MKEDIDDFKSKNGNNNFTTKEILMYVATKVEKIEERVASIKASQKYLWVIIGALSGAVFYLYQKL